MVGDALLTYEEFATLLTQIEAILNSRPLTELGDVVLIKDEVTPCARWPMARVSQLHPGRDGLVRVVTVTTAKGSYKRPVVKIVKLIDHEEC
uniref:DUF5641 domain-containing protein n=1 Tax=Trichogramma kaykai TaxID=54128 RepID=A0ABD2XDV5_9HYME